MRGAGGQVEYVKIMQDFDGRPKVHIKLEYCHAVVMHVFVSEFVLNLHRVLGCVSSLIDKMHKMRLRSLTSLSFKVCNASSFPHVLIDT